VVLACEAAATASEAGTEADEVTAAATNEPAVAVITGGGAAPTGSGSGGKPLRWYEESAYGGQARWSKASAAAVCIAWAQHLSPSTGRSNAAPFHGPLDDGIAPSMACSVLAFA
jgi:hypothetical protein